MASLSRHDVKTSDLLKVKNERTGEILRVVSPHDLVVGIADYKASDLKVHGDTYISGSMWIKEGVSGSLVLPDGRYALRAGDGIEIIDDGDGGFTINSVGGQGGSTSYAPKNAPFLAYQPSSGLTNEKVLSVTSPLTFDPTTAKIGFDSTANLSVGSISINGSNPLDYQFFVATPTPGLPNSKLISPDGGITISQIQSGIVIGTNSTVVKTSGAAFTGHISAPSITAGSLTGSLTKLANGSPYIRAGQGVSVVTASNGSIIISADSGGNSSAPVNAPYLLIGADQSGLLDNERVLSIGAGLSSTDSGAGSSYSIRVSDSQVPFLTGAMFSGPVTASFLESTGNAVISGSVTARSFTGSLTRVSDGSDFLLAGSGISISTGSNGSITITNTGATGDITSISAGLGLLGGGTSGDVTLSIDVSSVAFLTGSQFTGAVTFAAGLTGSITQLVDGSSFLRAGNGIVISTGSDGSVTIESSVAGSISGSFSGPVITYESSSIQNSRKAAQGTGILITTSSSGEVVFSIDPQVGSAAAYLSKLALNEQLVGQINGANRLFETARAPSDPSQLMIWLNGQLLTCGAGYDYTSVGNSVMFSSGSTPQPDDTLAVMYPYTESSSRYILNERVDVAEVDNIITGELQYQPIEPRRLLLFWNGQLLSQGDSKDYTIVGKKIYINASLEELDPDDIFIATYMAYSGTAYYEVNEEITINYDPSACLWTAELSHEPSPASTLMLFMNGQLLKSGLGDDFISNSNQIVILDDEISSDFRFYATYQYLH